MNASLISAAYKYVAIALMVVEINICCKKLHLPDGKNTPQQNIRSVYVMHPDISGFGGVIETEDYRFIFYKSGVLRRIQRINRFDNVPLPELERRLSRLQSLVNTNEAYNIATNWLANLSVDVGGLERHFSVSIEQKYFYARGSLLTDGKRVILVPIYHVFWGDKRNPTILVSIFGPTKELLAIIQNDDSFSKRPRDLLKEGNKLLAISDQNFKKFSASQLDELVAQYSIITNPVPSTNDFVKTNGLSELVQESSLNTSQFSPSTSQ